jgi:hypothetical protein
VTVVALLAGWCSYCQSQASKMEQMRVELNTEGYDVQFMAINGKTADNSEDRQKLVDRCSFPLFQDHSDWNAWTLHKGGKDDIYVYRADGTLAIELDAGGDIETNLSTEEGYGNLRQAILDAM